MRKEAPLLFPANFGEASMPRRSLIIACTRAVEARRPFRISIDVRGETGPANLLPSLRHCQISRIPSTPNITLMGNAALASRVFPGGEMMQKNPASDRDIQGIDPRIHRNRDPSVAEITPTGPQAKTLAPQDECRS